MEFPIVLYGLSRVNIVTSQRLKRVAPLRDPRDRRSSRRSSRRAATSSARSCSGSRCTSCSRRRPGSSPEAAAERPAAPASRRRRRPDRSRRRLAVDEWLRIPRPVRPGGRRPAAGAPARRDPERAVGGGQDRGDEAVRGPRLHLRRQPAGRAAARAGRARLGGPRAVRARSAIVLDVRAGDASLALAAMRGALEGRGIRPQVFFLEARDEVLIRRFSETRHRHPLADQRGIASSIAEERRLLEPVRDEADVVLDTSDLAAARAARADLHPPRPTQPDPDRLAIQLISFGFKYGVPLEADLVFDVRFMQNPYYIDELRQLSGLTEAVREFVLGQPVDRAASSAYLHEFLDVRRPGLRRRGQDPADDRHRLHRRLPPLDRHRRGARGLAARAGLRRRSRSSTASSSGREPMTERPRRSPRSHELRRWLTPGIGDQALAGRRLPRRARARPRAGASSSARSTATSSSASRSRRSSRRRHAPVPAVPAPGADPRPSVGVGDLRLRRRTRSSRVLMAPFRSDDEDQPARRGDLPEALPGPRPADRRARRRDRPVDAPARPQGAHQQPDRDRDGRRRRRLVGQAARPARDAAGRRHPQLHRRAGRRRAADGPAAPVPLPGRGRRPTSLGGHADRQPPDRGDDRGRGRRLRGGRPADEPGPGRPRPGRAGLGDAARPPRRAARRDRGRWASRGSPRRPGSTGSG